MIAITDISGYSNVDVIQANTSMVIPSQSEIQSLIGSSDFINSTITTAFKNLLIQISNETIDPIIGNYRQSSKIVTRVSQMFNRVGFYIENGIIQFQVNLNALDAGTAMIINELHEYTDFQTIAYKAFHDNSWAKKANDIRAMTNSGLQKLHYITVYSNSNSNSAFNYSNNIDNPINILNSRDKHTGRILVIDTAPNMPQIRIKNNSNERIRIRLKVYFTLLRTDDGEETIYRNFIDYFPEIGDPFPPPSYIDNHTVIINADNYHDIDYGNKILGGNAVIEYIPESLNWETNWNINEDLQKFIFYIRAVNPVRNDVVNYLTSSSYISRYWFITKLIRHESGTHSRNEFRQFNPKGTGYNYNGLIRGLPNFGTPKGYGLGQIDNSGTLTTQEIANLGLTSELAEIQPGASKEYQTIIDSNGRTIDYERQLVASDQEVWHWKRNIDAIIKVIEDKINTLLSDIAPNNSILEYGIPSMRNFIQAWNTSNPSNQVVFPEGQVEDEIVYSAIRSDIIEFSSYNNFFPATPVSTDTLKSFFDAMLIKAYNGLGSQIDHYLHLSPVPQIPGIKPVLTIKNIANNNNYVKDISREEN